MTLHRSLTLFAAGLVNLWLIGHFVAYQICVAAGNGVCVAS